jgi:putative transposase
LIVFIDESGLSQRPTRVRTWAVKGESPVVQFRFNWDHISVIAGMHFAGVCFRLHDGSVKQEQVVEFLKALKAHYRRRLLILWDGGRPHRSRLVRDYVDSTEGHIQFAFLPPYAPELNPVEYLWAWLKRHALANFCPTRWPSCSTPHAANSNSAQRRSAIVASCWAQAELF